MTTHVDEQKTAHAIRSRFHQFDRDGELKDGDDGDLLAVIGAAVAGAAALVDPKSQYDRVDRDTFEFPYMKTRTSPSLDKASDAAKQHTYDGLLLLALLFDEASRTHDAGDRASAEHFARDFLQKAGFEVKQPGFLIRYAYRCPQPILTCDSLRAAGHQTYGIPNPPALGY